MATATDIRKTTTDLAKTIYGPKTFYAVAGVGDLAVEKIKNVPDRVSKLRDDIKGSDVKGQDSGVTAKVRKLPKTVADKITDLPAETRKLGDKLTDRVDEQVKTADERYGKLVTRGEDIVKRVRTQKSTKDLLDQAKSTVTKARSVRGSATKGATNTVKNTKTHAKATVTSARKTAAKAGTAASDAAAKVGD